jgi:flagella basal body P-ring formation protein FlgA
MTRRMLQPLFLVALAALGLLSARHAGAQQASPRRLAIATRTIARGSVLTAADFEYRDSVALRAADDTTPVAAGWVTRRVISAGEVLRTPAVEPPQIVTANSPVQIEWKDQNISVSMRGTVTRNGAIGEHVTVRTEQGRRMEATVVGPGRVRID